MDFRFDNVGPDFAPLMIALGLGMALGTLAVHVAFAFGVFNAASRRQTFGAALRGKPTAKFVPPFVWGLATLIGGVFVAAAYWLMHDSALVANEADRQE